MIKMNQFINKLTLDDLIIILYSLTTVVDLEEEEEKNMIEVGKNVDDDED